MFSEAAQTEEAMVIVTDNGFAQDELATNAGYRDVTVEELVNLKREPDQTINLTIDVAGDAEVIEPYLGLIDVISVPFGSSADGRGFSVATQLRRAGFAGRLRAVGHVIVDQYAHARRTGFDEVAISADQAARQPEAQWLAEVPKINATYQIRLHQADEAA